MPKYICIQEIKDYKKDEIIPGRKFRKLLPAEQLYFKVYVPAPEKSLEETIEDGIIQMDKEEN